MLLAIRPSDKNLTRLAAVLLSALCFYYLAFLVFDGNSWNDAFVTSRSCTLLAAEVFWGTLFFRAVRGSPPERASSGPLVPPRSCPRHLASCWP